MFTVAIVEDDPAQRTALARLTEDFFTQQGEEIRLLTFSDGSELLSDYPSPNLILMDIDMPKMNGLETAKRLRTFDTEVLLIFITNIIQCALEGYKVEAMDFLVKPADEYSCHLSFSRALRRMRRQRGYSIEVRYGKNTFSVNTLELLYAETQGHSLLLHLRDGSTLSVTESIQSLTERLRPLGFFRCHTSYLVNLSAVDTIRRSDTVVSGVVLPVSKYRREEFMKAMAEQMGGSF